MKTITNKIFGALIVAVLACAGASTAFAGSVSWARPNTSPYGTIDNISGNSEVNSKVYGSSIYTKTTNASAGDRVAVVVYFHNSGTANSTNTIIKLDRPGTGASTSFTLGGSVSGGGSLLFDTTTINLSSSQTLTFIPGSLRVSYDQGRTDTGVLSNETDIFNGGLNIGLVRGMNTCATNALCAQGSVALGFQVSTTQQPTGTAPTVITGSYVPFSETAGYATLQGSVSPNGAAACSYFKYRNTTTSSWETTTENCLSQTTGNYAIPSAYVSGLSAGTYEYQACARNSYGTNCGSIKTFTIVGQSQAQCVISSFTASPTTVNSGGYTTLAWSTSNCDKVTIDGINYPVNSSGNFGPIYANATYQIKAWNTATPSNIQTQSVNVSVNQVQSQCVINTFTGSPLNVTSGGYTTLSWTTTNCDYLTIDGVNYGVDGSGTFGPITSSRNYELKAWKSGNASNPQTQSVYIGVVGAPVYQCNDNIDNDGDGYIDYPNDPGCYSPTDNTESPFNSTPQCVINTFTGSPLNVNAGGYTTLSWNTTNCDTVTIDGVNYPVDGSGTFGPLYSGRSYELKAWKSSNPGNLQMQTVYIGVNNVQQNYYQCNDGYDNDGDGYTDYPNDPSCYSSTGNSEYPYNGNNNNNNLYVTTENYSWINQDSGSITLRGRYTGNNYGSVRTYFEYRLNGQSIRTITSDISNNSSLSFNVSLYNLAQGSYEYRACAGNNYQCGVWLPFYVNQNYTNQYPTNNQPTVQTLNPIQYSTNFATLDGYYNMNGCSGNTYFEYGTNTGFGYTTPQISRSQSGSMAASVSNLLSGTTYYYRAVASNCAGTVRGDVRQFTTPNQTIRDNTPIVTGGGNTTTIIRNVTTATNIGGGAQYIRLTIDNGRDTIVRGDELIYDVTWENISRRDLKDLVLEVSFPQGLQVTYADRGQIDRKANTVYVNIRELRGLEKDDMTIRARVSGSSFKDNDPITARAIIAFENPENKAQENAIAYDSDTFLSSTNVLGASIFGLDFLPGTLAGWLFIILLLILIFLIIRYATRGREEHHHYYPTDKGPGAPIMPTTPVTPMASTTTTTEVEYTPYRPTPRN